MIIRATDENGDWTFGKGRNNYRKDNQAVIQNIDSRLQAFLGDCFFDQTAGIDWFNLLGNKNQIAMNLAIAKTILTSRDVVQLLQLSVNLDPVTRAFSATYMVDSVYSSTVQTTEFNPETI